MDIVRNFIHVVGITPGEELPEEKEGQVIELSEAETLYIPAERPPAQNIFQVVLQVEIVSSRRIHAFQRDIVVIDGVKEYKIIYGAKGDSDNAAGFLVLRMPFNTFYELPDGQDSSGKVEAYVLDAYFQILDDRRIYSHLLYYIHVRYEPIRVKMEGTKKRPQRELGDLFSAKNEKAYPYQDSMTQSVIDEILVSSEAESSDDVVKENDKVTGGTKQSGLTIDIDAEYL